MKPQQYTNWVVTMWYRAPELLLGTDIYNQQIDMWSVACIFAELVLREPLFAGKSEMDQIEKIFAVIGNPTEKTWPGFEKLKLAGKLQLNKKHSANRLRDKFPMRPCGPADSMYLTDCGIDLLSQLFSLNPETRPSAKDALTHPWFQEDPAMATEMPIFPEMNKVSRQELKKNRRKSLDERQL